MRQIDVSSYTVAVRNDQGEARFTEETCQCGLDLTKAEPTNVRVKGPRDASGDCPNCNEPQTLVVPEFLDIAYAVKDSLIELLFAKDLQLTGVELVERDEIAQKIASCDGCLLLEEAEWAKLNRATELVRGLGRSDVELVKRIVNAGKVEVEEKK